jgi:hypothetical protein
MYALEMCGTVCSESITRRPDQAKARTRAARLDRPLPLTRLASHHSCSAVSARTHSMMATAVFSQHSSNPLEVGSSDQRNREYKRRVQREVEAGASEDPCNAFSESNLDRYHKHLGALFPNFSALHHRRPSAATAVELDDDDDMLSEPGPQDTQLDDGEEPPDAEDDGDGEAEAEAEADEDGADTDEEISLFLRPAEERLEIEREIAELEEAMPALDEDYRILDRLGTGTFSSVYKAVDLGYHTKWDNAPWLGSHPPSSSAHYQSVPVPHGTPALVAIKRIYVTSNPERIRNEIAIMEDCRSCRHVSQMITAFRHQDQVVIVMPYHRNLDFRVGLLFQLDMCGVLSGPAGLLPTTAHGRHQGVLPLHVSCTTGHPRPEHHPPRRQARQLSIRSADRPRHALRLWPRLRARPHTMHRMQHTY